ncbi:MAG: DUF222 domain-containing protein [Jatrophihabitans sp.]|uniref:DUF222 domain-containing protein n=1 Tax=Jatrophihabitans sp. TaxID=1932789 RepID=UPI003F822C71
MTGDGRLPSGTEELAPGAALAGVLESLDLGGIDDPELLAALSAANRMLSWAQARVWAVMAEVGRRDPAPLPGRPVPSRAVLFDLAVAEIRAELRLTRASTRIELETAQSVEDLPLLAAAMAEGRVDRARARVLVQACADLSPEHASRLVEVLLPGAAAVTAPALADRARRVAVELDADWAERRYRAAVRDRKVVGYLSRDGSAVIEGSGLPAHEAAAACDHLDTVAAAAKRAGAHAPLDHVRADLFLGLLDGRWIGHTRDQLVAALVAMHPARVDDPESEPDRDVAAANERRDQPARPEADDVADAAGLPSISSGRTSAPSKTVPALTARRTAVMTRQLSPIRSRGRRPTCSVRTQLRSPTRGRLVTSQRRRSSAVKVQVATRPRRASTAAWRPRPSPAPDRRIRRPMSPSRIRRAAVRVCTSVSGSAPCWAWTIVRERSRGGASSLPRWPGRSWRRSGGVSGASACTTPTAGSCSTA